MIVLAGPTASGKTELAVSLALRLGGEVVSADSRQVYRLLDAATAKPSAAQRARVPHHLLDVVNPDETYDSGRFIREAKAAIAAIQKRGKLAIVCGGTGLYLRALLEGLAPLPPRDEALRERLTALGKDALHARLTTADPKAAAAIPAGNVQRVVRALEVLELTGRPISSTWGEKREGGVDAERVLTLEVPSEILRRRVEARAKAMWPALLAEVRALVPSRFRGDEPGFTSLGYREALAVLKGESSSEDGLEEMIRATHAYVKRQRTWFRHQLPGARPVKAEKTPDETFANALADLSADLVRTKSADKSRPARPIR
ncbi:MAG TPA: tRNA (adenosine(37)-N6)-dimethylallyltransferase MiaA [Elusimicrobiota bacterium]|nr:tRNA (adenosine(37)-N6)-dimethylallyltransferase MiaA [Elusimicrobiota bacterium]